MADIIQSNIVGVDAELALVTRAQRLNDGRINAMRDQDIGVVIGELTRIVKRASTNHAAIIERDPLIAARHPYF